MKLIICAALALGIAWLLNRFWLRLGLKEQLRVGYLAPLGEELIKYVVATLFYLSLPFFYACFGLGEGIYETILIHKRLVIPLILAGVIVHLSSSVFFLLPLPLWMRLGLAIAAHLCWNNFVLVMNKHDHS